MGNVGAYWSYLGDPEQDLTQLEAITTSSNTWVNGDAFTAETYIGDPGWNHVPYVPHIEPEQQRTLEETFSRLLRNDRWIKFNPNDNTLEIDRHVLESNPDIVIQEGQFMLEQLQRTLDEARQIQERRGAELDEANRRSFEF